MKAVWHGERLSFVHRAMVGIYLAIITSCSTGSLCLSGNCVDGICCDLACTGLCQACTAAKKGSGTNGTCGNVGIGSDPDNECPSGDCNGSGSCVSAQPLANGSACASNGQFLSGFCADSVCCASACNGPCEVCTIRGAMRKRIAMRSISMVPAGAYPT
jgi:hypothetical protein